MAHSTPEAATGAEVCRSIHAISRFFFSIAFIAALLIVVPWSKGALGKEPGWLGMQLTTVTASTKLPKGLALKSGALVLSVDPAGPAAKAGLRIGDIILDANGRKIMSSDDLQSFVESLGEGATVALTRVRAGEGKKTVSVVLAAKPASAKLKRAPSAPPKTRAREAPSPDISAPKAPENAQPSPPTPKNGGPKIETRRFEYRVPTDEAMPAAPPPDEQAYTTVKVFYATDRNKLESQDPAATYGPDRGILRYGTCDVTVPKDHRVGELEAPSYLRLEFSEDPAKHVILSRVTEQGSSDFYRDVGAKVAKSQNSSAFVFVHGYNVTFKDAARRTAQMSYDLKFDGAPTFFSWPSQGAYVGYPIDEANVEYAKSDLKNFIAEFARNSTARQIYLVAHSMGNRALTGAISELFRESPDVRAKIKEIILAAPDIDADVFKRDIAPAITGSGQAVTLYSSSNDLALRASKKFHGYPRAGDTGTSLTVVPGITTIDSSDVETDFLGHSYFAESTSIIADIFNILSGLTKPEERTNLIAVDSQAGRYWKLRRVAP